MEYEKASEQRRGEETKYGGPEEINDNDGQNLHIYTHDYIHVYIHADKRQAKKMWGTRCHTAIYSQGVANTCQVIETADVCVVIAFVLVAVVGVLLMMLLVIHRSGSFLLLLSMVLVCLGFLVY